MIRRKKPQKKTQILPSFSHLSAKRLPRPSVSPMQYKINKIDASNLESDFVAINVNNSSESLNESPESPESPDIELKF